MAIATARDLTALDVIDYDRIHTRDPTEVSNMLKACQPPPVGWGMFLLDLRGPSGKETLGYLRVADQAIKSYFHQSVDVKMAHFRDGIEKGFKHPGEAIETFEVHLPTPTEAPEATTADQGQISIDDELQGTHTLPPGLQARKRELSALSAACDAITRDILAALCPSPDLAPPGPSDSGLKLCLQSAKTPVGEITAAAHTDMGLLTLMTYPAACVELGRGDGSCKDGEQTWTLVEPVDGCVIVNVGDALQAELGGYLRSPLHRVLQPEVVPDGGTCFTAYFLRPNHGREVEV